MNQATDWFNEIPSFEDVEMDEAVKEEWRADKHTQWCWRHWAPCPVLHFNGIGMFVVMQKYFLEHMAPASARTPEQLNFYMNSIGRLCCTIGDDKMHEMWQEWAPTN
jgi:hypothetical protein